MFILLPVYLWGDDVQHNQSHEKPIVVVAGHALDQQDISLTNTGSVFGMNLGVWMGDCLSHLHDSLVGTIYQIVYYHIMFIYIYYL